MGASSDVHVERRDGVVRISLDHEPTRNSLATSSLGALAEALRAVDPAADRCVVVGSAVPGSFCSGFRLDADVATEMRSGRANALASEVYELLSGAPVPTVAAIDGPAHGGGCELALRCDLRVASARASFAVPAAKLGFPYTAASLEFMVRRFGQPATALLMVGGSRLGAGRAAELGLATSVVEVEDHAAEVDRVVAGLCAAAPLVLRYLRTAIAAAEGRPADVAAARAAVEASADFAEAVQAAAQRRPARFEGR
ncbi:MAG: enoyl-CoA hydratase/isomerase family protein [Acidimicrobiia bacterium]